MAMRLQSFPLIVPAVLILAALLGVVYLQQSSERASQPPAGASAGEVIEIGSSRRPSPQAVETWQDRKFGMFIHWGLYSVLGGVWKGERVTDIYSEQIMLRAPIPLEEYTSLTSRFNPEKWDPRAVARLAKEAGMKFIVITSKHHDGFCLFETTTTNYDTVDSTPYGRDVIKELAEAARAEGLSFGVYYSSIDWHWGSVPDKRNDNPIPKELEDFNVAQLVELMSNYGPMSEIWFDMGNPAPAQSKRWADTVHTLQPDTMVSGRVFNHQGDFTVMGDNAIPDHIIDEPWQTPGSIYDDTWGYRSWQERGSVAEKVREHLLNLVKVVSRGGNYLLNIGPRGDGSVVEFEADVLRSVGKWLTVNGEAIYNSKPQPFRQLDFGYVTCKPGRLYLLVTRWPADGKLRLPAMRNPVTKAYFLSDTFKTSLDVAQESGAQVVLVAPPKLPEAVTVIAAEYSGDLSIAPPILTRQNNGTYLLMANDAREFFHYNGRGYYEKPKLYKQEWLFSLPSGGDYDLYATVTAVADAAKLAIDLNGDVRPVEVAPKPAGQGPGSAESGATPTTTVKVGELKTRGWEDLRLTATPPQPFAKGQGMGVRIESVELRPRGSASPASSAAVKPAP